MRKSRFLLLLVLVSGAALAAGKPIKALIVDGQNNHDWKATTPLLKKILEDSGRFTVDVATSPAPKADMSGFKPQFSDYKVVVMNYAGDAWPQETQTAFVNYVSGGGGVVIYHAADNAFTEWREYNEMIGLGGWGGRDEKAGPMVRYRDGKFVRDTQPGKAGHHGKQHEFQIINRDLKHPINAGLPEKWMHAKDELYDSMRGPAINLNVISTAFSDRGPGGTGEHEPMLMVLRFGKGKIFHTGLGHAREAMECVGFMVTLVRGAEWTATGKVTSKVPADFPTADKVSTRPLPH